MVDSCSMKHPPADLKGLFFLLRRRRTKAFAYAFMLSFLLCTAYIAFNPSFGGTPWLTNFLSTASASTDAYRSRLTSFLASASASTSSYKSQFSSFISSFFPNSTLPDRGGWSPPNLAFGANRTGFAVGSPKAAILAKNLTSSGVGSSKDTILLKNSTSTGVGSAKVPVLVKNLTTGGVGSPRIGSPVGEAQQNTSFSGIVGSSRGSIQTKSGAAAPEIGSLVKNHSSSTVGSPKVQISSKNLTTAEGGSGSGLKAPPLPSPRNQSVTGVVVPKKSGSSIGGQIKTGPTLLKSDALVKNMSIPVMMSPSAGTVPSAPAAKTQTNKSSFPAMPLKQVPPSPKAANGGGTRPKWNIESMRKCNLFHGKWVKDESYPMYPPGSCPHIDESFDCFLNGRPEFSYQKLRWQPHGCYIPRLNATDMLERLRGKRLVFVGDSLNRNMWESLVCILTNSVKDKSKVFESSGRHEFKTDGSYSFVFKDYNCTVEFFRSVFLVQEWEMRDTSGNEKETLRLDMIAKSSDRYKDADIIVFNTGHWWTHDKTAKGKDYYQEGNRIYSQLNVVDAFHKALNTWAKWVDANVNSRKTTVFFRGYSSSHFSGGQWNSGGQCDAETEPIKNEHYLAPYPPKMDVLESVLQRMKTPVAYLNITRMTNYRKDAHPSIYRKPNLTEDERRAPNRYQDCSHWCLPGVPDSWNELLYAQLLIKQYELH